MKFFNKIIQTHILFVTIALFFGFIFIFLIPPNWGVDEDVHFDRAYQISTGILEETKLGNTDYGGRLPEAIVKLNNYVKTNLLNVESGATKELGNVRIYHQLENAKLTSKTETHVFSGAGAYSPLAYLAPVAGIVVARFIDPTVGSVLIGARIVTLLTYVTLVAVSLYILRKRDIKWLVFVCALLPMSLFQASIVSVDSFATAFSIFLFAQLLAVWGQKNQLSLIQLVILTITALALTLSKPEYLLLAIAICFIPSKILTQRQTLYVRIVLPFLVILTALLWNYETSAISTAAAHLQRGPTVFLNATAQLKQVLINPFRFLHITIMSALKYSWFDGVIGILGYNFVLLPTIVISYFAVLLSWSTMYTGKAKTSLSQNYKKGSIYLGVALLCGGSIITTFYIIYNSVGSSKVEGVQGRYFLPLLPFFLYGLRKVLPVRLNMSSKLAPLFFATTTVLGLVCAVAWYYKITYLPLI